MLCGGEVVVEVLGHVLVVEVVELVGVVVGVGVVELVVEVLAV